MNLKRVAEKSELYDDHQEVTSYCQSSRGGLVGFIEYGFFRKILRRYGHRESLKVLDMGTGPGWIPTRIARAMPSWQITGLDASELMLTKARAHSASRKVKIEFVHASADQSNLPSDHFDLVISHFALHEFPDPQAVIQEMLRVVKKDGEMFIQDLARPHPLFFPFLQMGMFIGHPLSPNMRRQGESSLRSSYNVLEMQKMLQFCGLPFEVRHSALLSLIQIWVKKIRTSSPLEKAELLVGANA